MTHHNQSALRGLINELLNGDEELPRGEAMRRLLETSLQELIEAEVTARIGAGRYERSTDRVTRRNGARPKQLATPAGTLELTIPKLREGSFFPSLLEPRRRIDQALWSVIAQAWIGGVSTRRVDALIKALGNETGISRSTVSRICAEIDEYVSVFLARRLDDNDAWYPYLWLDATYVKCRREGRVASTAVVTAIGCDAGGWRRVLGVDVVDTESYDSWLAFLRAIRSRGAAGVRLVVSDAHPGLVRALGEVFQGAAWQRCAVHLMRDCMREAGSWQLRRRVGRIVSQVFRGRDAATVTAMYHAACDMLEGCCPRAAAVLEEAEPDALAYLDFPPTHWKRLRTNNVQERTNREIKRRSRVVQVFPSTGSLVRLAGAVMCEQDEIWQESRYFSEVRMNELYDDGRTRGIDGPVDWARLEAEARKMLESGLELADRVEAA